LMNAPAWLTVLLFVFAGTTKEVAFPFLAAIGFLCLLQAPTQSRKQRAVSLVVAALLNIAATVAFNLFRYGTFFNTSYLDRVCIVPTFKLQLSFFLGIWLSPNGGLVFFWPSFVLLLLGVTGIALLKIGRPKLNGGVRWRRQDVRFYAPLLGTAAI